MLPPKTATISAAELARRMSFRTDKYGRGYGAVMRCGAIAFMCIWFAVGQVLGQVLITRLFSPFKGPIPYIALCRTLYSLR